MVRVPLYGIASLHAIATFCATFGGVVLVALLRPDRRAVPFYSDASHRDPERVILALFENLACLLLPAVGLGERAQHIRLLGQPLPLIARINSVATAATAACFYITANTPTLQPWIALHQFAASGLLVGYSIQAVCKLRIAKHTRTAAAPRPVRTIIALALCCATVVVFLAFATRTVVPRTLDKLRVHSISAMATAVHVATAASVALMAVLARDLRNETLVIAAVVPPCDALPGSRLVPRITPCDR